MNKRELVIATILVLLLAGFLRLFNIGWAFSSNGIDEGIMVERALMVDRGYHLYSGLPCDQAPLAFYIGALLGGDVLALRVLTAALSIISVLAAMIAARMVKGSIAMLATGLLLAVDFVLVRESRLFSLDAISGAFLAFSIVPFLLYIRKESRFALVVSGVLIGLSVATKLLGALGLLGMVLFLVLDYGKNLRPWKARIFDMIILIAVSSIPLALFTLYLGPSATIQGMVLDQGHRGSDLSLKASILAYLAVNTAYALTLFYFRGLWRMGREFRFLIITSLVLFAFVILQPLTFLHHLVMISPALAVLAGVVIAGAFERTKSPASSTADPESMKMSKRTAGIILAFSLAGILVSAGLAGYGLAAQGTPIQSQYAELIREHSGSNDWVISGDPLMAALADRQMPPEIVNDAYRIFPDLTLQDVESAVNSHSVKVVVLCYRLGQMQGLPEFLESNGYQLLPGTPSGGEPVLNLFESGIGPITLYYKS